MSVLPMRGAAVVVLLAAGVAAAQSSSSTTVTLGEVYRGALAASETISISEQSIRRAEALYHAALGSSFPNFAFRSVSVWQDGNGGTAQTDGMIRLSQLSLSGYRELFAVRAAKANAGQAEFQRRRAEQLLLSDVAGAFFGFLQSQENARVTRQLVGFADQRLKELHERVRVGRSREADAIAQEVQLAGLASQLEESERLSSARIDLLSYLIRAPMSQPRTPDEPVLQKNSPLTDYLARVDRRPDVAASLKAAEAAASSVHVARADRFPQLGLQADYYGYRPAIRTETHWDGQLIVTLPIWSWGALSAAVDAAKAGANAQELALRSVRRQGDLEIRDAFRDNASARRQLDIQKRAVELAERDYSLQTRDERRGLVTSIEVLQSLDRLNGARLAFTNALLQARLATINLELAAGARPEDLDLR